MALDAGERLRLVTRNAEETITLEEMRRLLGEERHPRAYWGFECSGLMHLGLGLVCGSKIRDLVEAGFDFTIFLADWHSWINNKLGGDMEKIRLCGEYFRECFTALGVKPDSVRYVWASDIAGDRDYWETVIRVAKAVSLQRTWRALPIMGREMSLTDMETAWVYYPCMQAADIFHLDLDVACAGMDQRRAHMLARDVAERLGRGKPLCVHTPLLMGLQGPEKAERRFDEDANLNLQISSKMAKSIPGSCVYIHDSPEEIRKKMRDAYCPPGEAQGNPVLGFAKHLVFSEGKTLEVPRPRKYGGPESFKSYEDLESAYVKGKLHPLDLKNGVAEALVETLSPVRKHFQSHPETLKKMREIGITR